MRAFLLANPAAGRVRGAVGITRLVAALEAVGLTVTPIIASHSDAVEETLRAALHGQDPHETRVVVAGGDGTISAALPALIDTPFPMAILPVGSVNVLARELGLPLSLPEAARVAAGDHLRRLDLGRANGRPFAINTGIGFDAAVVHAVRPALKHIIGVATYITQGLVLLAHYRASHFQITLDDDVIDQKAWLAVVSNTARYSYHLRLCPEATAEDGWLDLCLFQESSRGQMARQVMAVLREHPVGYPGIQHFRARRFRFECDPPLPVQLDGDPAGITPLEVTVAPQALSVIVSK